MENADGTLRVLFLCAGNSCRSQMAEGWAKHLKAGQAEPPVGPESLLHLIGSRNKTLLNDTMNKPTSLVRQVQG